MKGKFAGSSAYPLAEFTEMGMSPFQGMEAGKKRYNGEKELYWRIIEEIIQSDSKKAMEGIINALEEPEYQWWPGFFEKYLTRQLVDVSEVAYTDLSAKLFKVSFLFPSFEKEATLNLKLGPPSLNMDYVTTLVFGLKNNQLEYFVGGNDLTITSMKALADNYYFAIVVAVVNSANEPTTDETLNIELETRKQTAPEDLNYVLINSIRATSTYTDNFGDISEGSVLYLDGTPRKGEIVNNTFTATWSEPYSDGTSSGTIDIKFDPDQFSSRITEFRITKTRKLSDTNTFWGRISISEEIRTSPGPLPPIISLLQEKRYAIT
jgi:hypothetical protein